MTTLILFLRDRPLVGDTGMYMFDLNRCNNRQILALIHIRPVHSSVSYQWAIYQKYDRRVYKSASVVWPLTPRGAGGGGGSSLVANRSSVAPADCKRRS